MYTPTKEEKKQLQAMINTPGWRVLMKATKNMEIDFFREFKNESLGDTDVIKKIHDKQNTLRGAEWVINLANNLSQESVQKK